jgi:hypothetical protein
MTIIEVQIKIKYEKTLKNQNPKKLETADIFVVKTMY